MKWYGSFEEVRFITCFYQNLDKYSFKRIGEDYNDIEEEWDGDYDSISSKTQIESDRDRTFHRPSWRVVKHIGALGELIRSKKVVKRPPLLQSSESLRLPPNYLIERRTAVFARGQVHGYQQPFIS